MNKSKKRTAKTIGFMIIFSIVVIALYFFIKTRTSPYITDSVSSMTEVEKLLTKDIPNSYPSSPREVLKLYSRITKIMHNEDIEEEQINELATQINYLFDDELITNKEHENYLMDLKVEISDFKKANRIIMNYVIEKSSSVVYWDDNEKSYASIIAAFTLKEGSDYSKIYEKFILRKDNEDKWKILGWSLSDKTDIDTEE